MFESATDVLCFCLDTVENRDKLVTFLPFSFGKTSLGEHGEVISFFSLVSTLCKKRDKLVTIFPPCEKCDKLVTFFACQ